MNNDLTSRFLLAVAIFLTVMYFMNWFAPQPPSAAVSTAPITTAVANPTNIAHAATPIISPPVSPIMNSSTPNAVYENLTITRAPYTAVFTSQNAAMKSYRLNDYYNLPVEDSNRSPLLLAEEMALGKTSLALQKITFAGAGGVSSTLDLRAVNWQVIAVPVDSQILAANGAPVADAPWETTDNQLIFEHTFGELRLRRVFDFSPIVKAEKNNFGFAHSLILENLSAAPLNITSLEMVALAGIVPDALDQNFGALKAVSGYYAKPNQVERVEDDLSKFKELSEFAHGNRNTVWLGFNNRFFASLMLVTQADKSLNVRFEKLNQSLELVNKLYPAGGVWLEKMLAAHPYQGQATLTIEGVTIPANSRVERQFAYYGGPLDDEIAEQFSPALNDIVVFSWSWLKPLGNILLFILNQLAKFTHNYGWAIVLLTLVVKIVLHPLTRKSMKSQKAMQKIQPLLKQIKEQYKKDPQRQQQETMRIFRENGVNPVGGCLPMLLQMPIFFALYGVFARCFVIRQQPFIGGWIDDLSQPDTIATFTNLPLIGTFNVNPLPLIYLVLQFIHMSMMPTSADPQMQSQQKMMKVMPLIFVFIFYSMPAGLVLYFAVQSLLTIVEHLLMKRGKDEAIITDNGVKVVDGKVVATTIPAGKGFKK